MRVSLLLLTLTAAIRLSAEGSIVATPLAPQEALTFEQVYQVNARVRLLPFVWIGRDNVGDGRVTWRSTPDGTRTITLLVGTDPRRTPRNINRWGYISEETTGTQTSVVGLMNATDEDDATLEEADVNTKELRREQLFRGVQATVRDRVASGRRYTFASPAPLTFADLSDAMTLLHAHSGAERSIVVPANTSPGFLTAVSAAVAQSLEPCRQRRRANLPPISYVYASTLYTLTISGCEYKPTLSVKKHSYEEVIDASFEVTNRTTRERTRFHLAYGTTGDARERPVRIVFRPRSWLEIELLRVIPEQVRHFRNEPPAAPGT